MTRWRTMLLIAATGCATSAVARNVAYRLPSEPALVLPAGAGAEETAAACAACHSLDYLATQPRGKGARFWQDSVAKMRNVYGAPLSDAEAATIGGYLARTFG